MADATKATISELKAYFEEDGKYPKVSMTELKDLKTSNEGKDYDKLARGIKDGSLNY